MIKHGEYAMTQEKYAITQVNRLTSVIDKRICLYTNIIFHMN